MIAQLLKKRAIDRTHNNPTYPTIVSMRPLDSFGIVQVNNLENPCSNLRRPLFPVGESWQPPCRLLIVAVVYLDEGTLTHTKWTRFPLPCCCWSFRTPFPSVIQKGHPLVVAAVTVGSTKHAHHGSERIYLRIGDCVGTHQAPHRSPKG